MAAREDRGGEGAGAAADVEPVEAVGRAEPVEEAGRELPAPAPHIGVVAVARLPRIMAAFARSWVALRCPEGGA